MLRGLPALGQMPLVAGASPGSYTNQKDGPGGVDSADIFSFPLSVLPGLTSFIVRFRMSVPQMYIDFTVCKGFS